MSQFDLYAAYYDLLYQDKDYATEVDYIERLIKKHNGKEQSTILELGSGTGGHAFHLAEHNWQVTGIDLSPKMVDSANKHKDSVSEVIKKRLNFETGDARTYRSNIKFDVIVSLFHVMSYQVSNEDLISAFTATRSNLIKDGLFIFDFWYGPGVLTDRPKNVNKVVENDKIIVDRKTQSLMMINENCVDVGFDIEIKAKKSGDKHKVTEHHMMRYWFLPELQHHLSNAGIKLLGAYQWMTLDPMTDDTWYGCMVGQAV